MKSIAGLLGLEPRLMEPESIVLPITPQAIELPKHTQETKDRQLGPPPEHVPPILAVVRGQPWGPDAWAGGLPNSEVITRVLVANPLNQGIDQRVIVRQLPGHDVASNQVAQDPPEILVSCEGHEAA